MTKMTPIPTQTSPDEILARIAAALNDPSLSGSDLAALHKLAEQAETEALAVAAQKRQDALEPSLPQEAVSAALAEAQIAAFSAERLAHARGSLWAQTNTCWENEGKDAQKARYDHAEKERDRCAERLRQEYPEMVSHLVDLLSDLMATNELVDFANQNRPEGFPVLQRPEGKARGFYDKDNLMASGGAAYNADVIRLPQMVLPDPADASKLAWPPGMASVPTRRIRGNQMPYAQVRKVYLAWQEPKK